jgi:hypothetical protein
MSEFLGYMRATVFAPKRAVFPAYVQPKHNGIRCLDDGITGWTREGNVHKPHIQKLLKSLPKRDGWTRDGELVLPRHKFSFQQTQSAVAAENEDSRLLTLQTFDGYDPSNLGMKFSDRLSHGGIPCETHLVHDMDAVEYWYNNFLASGYEGLIFRQDVPYKFGSAGRILMKYKPSDTAEFQCIGIKENKGKAAGTPTFLLLRPNVDYTAGTPANKKNSFAAMPDGDYDKKRALWEKYKDGSCIGKWYQVEFADRYDSGVPQFPVGKGFRKVDGPAYE